MKQKVIYELRKFVAPEFLFGVGSRFEVANYVCNFGGRRVLVVSDPGVVAAGWTSDVTGSLEAAYLEYTLFTDVHPNPRDHEVMAGAEVYQKADCDTIVVVGGGSPIDCAKGIAIVVANGGKILDYEGVDTVPEPGPPLICVPTTAGTGADVSQFVIIMDVAQRSKIAIIAKAVVPDVSLIDPETTITMDPFLTVCTGVDSLTHAIEALVSSGHSPMTDLQALSAVELVHNNIRKVILNPTDLEVRQNMALATVEAGLAFSNASLGATHAMAHSLGGSLDLPHGQCNAMLLDHVMSFNFPQAEQQYLRIGAKMGLELKGMTHQQMKKTITGYIEQLKRELGIASHLSELGVHRTEIKELARKAIADPCLVTNPREANQRDIEVVYEEAL